VLSDAALRSLYPPGGLPFFWVITTMSDKPASMYREISKPAHTRREYITGIPGSKIAQHKMGDVKADPDDYPVQMSLITEEEVQLVTEA